MSSRSREYYSKHLNAPRAMLDEALARSFFVRGSLPATMLLARTFNGEAETRTTMEFGFYGAIPA